MIENNSEKLTNSLQSTASKLTTLEATKRQQAEAQTLYIQESASKKKAQSDLENAYIEFNTASANFDNSRFSHENLKGMGNGLESAQVRAKFPKYYYQEKVEVKHARPILWGLTKGSPYYTTHYEWRFNRDEYNKDLEQAKQQVDSDTTLVEQKKTEKTKAEKNLQETIKNEQIYSKRIAETSATLEGLKKEFYKEQEQLSENIAKHHQEIVAEKEKLESISQNASSSINTNQQLIRDSQKQAESASTNIAKARSEMLKFIQDASPEQRALLYYKMAQNKQVSDLTKQYGVNSSLHEFLSTGEQQQKLVEERLEQAKLKQLEAIKLASPAQRSLMLLKMFDVTNTTDTVEKIKITGFDASLLAFLAIEKQHDKLLEFALKNGADCVTRTFKGKTIMQHVANLENPDDLLIKILSSTENISALLIEIVKQDDMETFKKICMLPLEFWADINLEAFFKEVEAITEDTGTSNLIHEFKIITSTNNDNLHNDLYEDLEAYQLTGNYLENHHLKI